MKAKVLSIFLLGNAPDVFSKNRAKQKVQADEILKAYGVDTSLNHFVTKDRDLLKIDTCHVEGFVIFPYTAQRFAPLIYLAETRKPLIIVGNENTFLNALETYDYLSDHDNAHLVFNPKDLKERIKMIGKRKWLPDIKVCLFDAGQWMVDGIAWQKNPLFQGRLNAQTVNFHEFLENCMNTDKRVAKRLARQWMKESKVLEPSFEDVVKTAQVYLALKAAIEETDANAAYVLWCGQFTKPLQAKLCFALAKLADDGIPVGCWRGGNLLPMLILHAVSRKPVFTPEALSYHGKTVTLKHCFAPGKIAWGKYTLRNWRDMAGTVTGYLRLPKGQVTLVNCGVGDRIVIAKGKVLDCKDLEGRNCRMTVWVELENEKSIHKLVGREFAMVYGDYEKDAKEMARKMGIMIL